MEKYQFGYGCMRFPGRREAFPAMRFTITISASGTEKPATVSGANSAKKPVRSIFRSQSI